MDIGTFFKLFGFLFWPLLIFFIYYLIDKEKFKKRLARVWEEIKRN